MRKMLIPALQFALLPCVFGAIAFAVAAQEAKVSAAETHSALNCDPIFTCDFENNDQSQAPPGTLPIPHESSNIIHPSSDANAEQAVKAAGIATDAADTATKAAELAVQAQAASKHAPPAPQSAKATLPKDVEALQPKDTREEAKMETALQKMKTDDILADGISSTYQPLVSVRQDYAASFIEFQKWCEAVRKQNGWAPDVEIDMNPKSPTYGRWFKRLKPAGAK